MKKQLFYCFIALILLNSCRKDPNPSEQEPSTAASALKLGKKLVNPYSVTNMRKAFQSLKGKIATISDDPVTTTHYYVRFLPSDTTQYDALKNDPALVLYPYPLDYEIYGESDDYFDTESNEATYQYAAVPIDYNFDSSIPHDILEELYIPEDEYGDEWDEYEYSSISKVGKKSRLTFLQQLVNESMKLTGNLNDTIRTSKGAKTKFEPSGTIRVNDTRLGLIPLVGVHVRARHWFRTKTTSTDDYGNYSLPNFRNPVNYSLVYETNRFDVRSGKYGQAWRNGPKQNYAWNVDINGDVQGFYAHVFRGARRFFYGNTGGLRIPNTTFGKLKYAAINGWDSRQNLAGKNRIVAQGGIMPDILIWRNSSSSGNREFGSDEIFSTTVHETAHTTHAQTMNGLIQFAQVSLFIVESWPTAVEWQVTQMEYQERGIAGFSGPAYTAQIPGTSSVSIFPTRFGYQNWTPATNSTYGSVFIDIIDNYNQGGTPPGQPYTGICDNLTGYTLAEIESSFLKHVYGVSSLSDELKAHKPSGVTDAQIDELLSFSTSGCAPAPPLSSAGLIAHWSFDGNGSDISGNNNTVSLYNISSTTDRFGNANSAYLFNGTNSYGLVADNVALRLNNTDFTINAWVKLNSYNSSYGSDILSKRIVGTTNGGWSNSIRGYASYPTGVMYYGPGGGSTNAFGTAVVGLGGWHKVTTVYKLSNGTISFYIDGVLNNTTSGILSANGSISASLTIGKDSGSNNYFLDGALDDIRIYHRALSTTEIQQL